MYGPGVEVYRLSNGPSNVVAALASPPPSSGALNFSVASNSALIAAVAA